MRKKVKRVPVIASQIGAALRRRRQQIGLKLKAVAESSGISVNQISLIELGRIQPEMSTLEKLCVPLGVSMAQLFALMEVQRQVDDIEKRALNRKNLPAS